VVPTADGVKNEKLPEASIVVGIMSSPSHFKERAAVRESWLQFTSLIDPKLNQLTVQEKQSIVIRFIIGNTTSPDVESFLVTESAQFYDIVRVPVLESYFNLTMKTAEFFKWTQATYNFKWLMKCDDDSFVRVDLILQDLLHRAPTPLLYMGKIWTGTPVDRRIDSHTPWKQHHPFAAGAGYVVSADIVSFIVRNYYDLFKFPLEDVAVGAWIAGLKVNYVDSPHFHSLPEGCDKDMLVQNPAEVDVMKATFFNAVKGIPCHNKPDPFDPKTKNITDHVLLDLGIAKTEPVEHVDEMQMQASTQMLISMPADDHEVEDAVEDDSAVALMNSNNPSAESVFNMNKGSTMVSEGGLEQASTAAVDRMNVAGVVDDELP